MSTDAQQQPNFWNRARAWLARSTTQRWLFPLLAAVITAIGTALGLPPEKVEVIKEVVIPAPAPQPTLDEFPQQGWVPDHDAIEQAAATLPTKVFAATPAGQTRDLPKDVFLWQLQQKLTGKPAPMKDQNPTGSCVGFGTTTAIERTLAAEIATRGGSASEFTLFSEEVTYAGSRVEVNGGRCPIRPNFRNPSGDGSNGSWAAKWATQWGMVPKGKYGNIDLTEYSAARARSWNYSGVPDELEPTARKHPVKDATRITNWQDAKKALANGYGIQIASNQGYARQRDANGVARPQGNWAHSMCLDGYHVDASGKEYGHIENSWSTNGGAGPYHVGPTGWGDPTGAGFWADADVVDEMLRQGDSWAYSGAVGFPSQKLDWFVFDVRPQAVPVIRIVRHDIPFTNRMYLTYEPAIIQPTEFGPMAVVLKP